MKLSNIARSLLAVAAIGFFAGCAGMSPEGSSSQPLTLANGQAPAGRHHRFGHGRLDQNQDGKVQLAELPPFLQQRLSAADTNHDGELSQEELQTHHQTVREARFAHLDVNNDGAITQEEAGDRWNRLGHADNDHDGRVSRAELAQAFEHRGMMGHHGFDRGPNPAHFIQRFDSNNDGTLQVSELPPPAQQRFGNADTNGDGVLSTDEITSAMEAHRAEWEARRHHETPNPAQPNTVQPTQLNP